MYKTRRSHLRTPVAVLEGLALTLALAACGGGGSDGSTTEASSGADEGSTAASAAADSMAAQAAAGEVQNAKAAAAGTGPSATSEVEAVSDRNDRATAAATPYATPKVAALEYTWTTTAAQQALLAKYKFVVIDKGRLRGAAAYDTFANGVHALNTSTKLAQYVINGETRCTADVTNLAAVVAGANAGNYWLRYANGAKAQWSTAYGACDINLSSYGNAHKNSAGQTWVQYKWQADRTALFGSAPKLDYVFIDTFFLQGRTTADWKLAGTNQSPALSEVASAYRAGQAAYITELRKTNPGLKVIGNTDNDLSSAQYKGLLDGAFLEAEMGKSWSTETLKGWAASLARYRAVLANTRSPKDVVYEAIGGQTEYRKMRYGLGTALLDNGYYLYRGTSTTVAPWWFDEYSAPLGAATQTPPTSATQNGVWSRTYENGIVLVNPQTWSATITIPAIYRRLSGTQVPSVNSGAAQSTITLGAKDALVMVRR